MLVLSFMIHAPNNDRTIQIEKNKEEASHHHYSLSPLGSIIVTHYTIAQAAADNYLGAYVRGEDAVRITGTLLDSTTGEPITGAIVYLYLNVIDNDHLLAENTTDSQGRFYFSVTLPINAPLGNSTLIVHFPGDIEKPYGPANSTYIVTIYGRVFVTLSASANLVPLFMKNTTCTARVLWDNGTLVSGRPLPLNISVALENTILNNFLVNTTSGYVTFPVNFTDPGNYYVTATLHIDTVRKTITPYVLTDSQILFSNGTVVGPPESSDNLTVQVYLANKIDLSFQQGTLVDVFHASRLGNIVIIYGKFYNVTGDPTTADISIVIYNEEFLRVFNITTADDGSFSLQLIINETYRAGKYFIYARDLNPTTVDLSTNLTLYVQTVAKIINFSTNGTGRMVRSGSIIYYTGAVIDAIDQVALANLSLLVTVSIGQIRTEKTIITDSLGNFYDYLKLPDDIPFPNIVLSVTVVSNDTLIGDSVYADITVYNFLILEVHINDTLFLWNYRQGNLLAYNQTSLSVPSNTTLILKLKFFNDFNQSIPKALVIVSVANRTYVDHLNENGELSWSFRLINESLLKVTLPDFNISVAIDLIPQFEETPQQFIIRGPFYYILFAFIIIGIASMIATREYQLSLTNIRKIFRKNPEWLVLFEEAKNYLLGNDIIGGLLTIRKALIELSREFNLHIENWMTLREIIREYSEKIKDKKLLSMITQLGMLYESVIYGLKKPHQKDILETINVIDNLINSVQTILSEEK